MKNKNAKAKYIKTIIIVISMYPFSISAWSTLCPFREIYTDYKENTMAKKSFPFIYKGKLFFKLRINQGEQDASIIDKFISHLFDKKIDRNKPMKP